MILLVSQQNTCIMDTDSKSILHSETLKRSEVSWFTYSQLQIAILIALFLLLHVNYKSLNMEVLGLKRTLRV